MSKKIYSITLIILVTIISVLIMVIPTFFTKNISRVKVDTEIKLPLILNDNKNIKIIFFGYAGCVDICTPRLFDLAKFYESLDNSIKNKIGIEFVDISIPEDKTLPQDFAQIFNKDFKGIYLNEKNLRQYTKAFSVYFSKSLLDKTEFDHSTNIYLVKRDNNKKKIRYIYNSYPYNFKLLETDIKELINE